MSISSALINSSDIEVPCFFRILSGSLTAIADRICLPLFIILPSRDDASVSTVIAGVISTIRLNHKNIRAFRAVFQHAQLLGLNNAGIAPGKPRFSQDCRQRVIDGVFGRCHNFYLFPLTEGSRLNFSRNNSSDPPLASTDSDNPKTFFPNCSSNFLRTRSLSI